MAVKIVIDFGAGCLLRKQLSYNCRFFFVSNESGETHSA